MSIQSLAIVKPGGRAGVTLTTDLTTETCELFYALRDRIRDNVRSAGFLRPEYPTAVARYMETNRRIAATCRAMLKAVNWSAHHPSHDTKRWAAAKVL